MLTEVEGSAHVDGWIRCYDWRGFGWKWEMIINCPECKRLARQSPLTLRAKLQKTVCTQFRKMNAFGFQLRVVTLHGP